MEALIEREQNAVRSQRPLHDFVALAERGPSRFIVGERDTRPPGFFATTMLVIVVAIAGSSLSVTIARWISGAAQAAEATIPCMFGP